MADSKCTKIKYQGSCETFCVKCVYDTDKPYVLFHKVYKYLILQAKKGTSALTFLFLLYQTVFQ